MLAQIQHSRLPLNLSITCRALWIIWTRNVDSASAGDLRVFAWFPCLSLQDPFVAGVTENDRVVIKLLLGEVNADFEETVEEIAPEDLVSFTLSSLICRFLNDCSSFFKCG